MTEWKLQKQREKMGKKCKNAFNCKFYVGVYVAYLKTLNVIKYFNNFSHDLCTKMGLFMFMLLFIHCWQT